MPSIWHVVNLRASPFDHWTLGAGGTQPLPEGLLVGRDADLDHLLRTIAKGHPTVQAVVGERGVGKTTLITEAKARARDQQFVAHDEAVFLHLLCTPLEVRARVLEGVYHAVLSNRPDVANDIVLRDARDVLLRRYVADPFTPALGDPLFGAEPPRRDRHERWVELEVAQALAALLEHLPSLGVRGVVLRAAFADEPLHASERFVGAVLSHLSAQVIASERLHVLFEMQPGTLALGIEAVPSLRAELRPHHLEALRASQVLELLARRFAFMRHDPSRPRFRIRDELAVRELYSMSGGNLRDTLRDLQALIRPWIGIDARLDPEPRADAESGDSDSWGSHSVEECGS
ncbi:MAG TPA: ATP-binding protein [Gemmatimonadaceae bacterium]|nr:ATP-binding protein [Gemmatimonadaceae bacterium]